MNRKEIHLALAAQITQMEITNNRLYLHEAPMSQLEIDLLRKQAIEYYDNVNRLALVAKQTLETENTTAKLEPTAPSNVEEVAAKKNEKVQVEEKKVEVEKVEEVKEVEPVKVEVEKKTAAIVDEISDPKRKEEKPKKAEKIEVKEKEMVIDKLSTDQDSIADRFKNQKIDSIKAAISISKRFEFQKNLFDDDHVMYGKTIDYFSEAKDLESGMSRFNEMLEAHGWDPKDQLVDELKTLIRRRYA